MLAHHHICSTLNNWSFALRLLFLLSYACLISKADSLVVRIGANLS